MGIKSLHKGLSFCTRKSNITKFAGQRIAVDASSWLHRSVYSVSEKYVESTEQNVVDNHCVRVSARYIATRCQELLTGCNMQAIILVMDGKRCPMKAAENEDREFRRQQNLTEARNYKRLRQQQKSEDKYKMCIKIRDNFTEAVMNAVAKQFSRDKRVQFVWSPYEADAQLAQLCIDRRVDAVITEDSDVLVYSAAAHTPFPIIFKLDRKSGTCDIICMDWLLNTQQLSDVDKKTGNALEAILRSLAFRQYKTPGLGVRLFVQGCVLSGCDYAPNKLSGVGLVTAFKAVRDNSFCTDAEKRLKRVLTSLPRKARAGLDMIEYEEILAKSEAVFYYHIVEHIDGSIKPMLEQRKSNETGAVHQHSDHFPCIDRFGDDISFLGVSDTTHAVNRPSLARRSDLPPVSEVVIPAAQKNKKRKSLEVVKKVNNPYLSSNKRPRAEMQHGSSRRPLQDIAPNKSTKSFITKNAKPNPFSHFARTEHVEQQPEMKLSTALQRCRQDQEDVRYVKRKFSSESDHTYQRKTNSTHQQQIRPTSALGSRKAIVGAPGRTSYESQSTTCNVTGSGGKDTTTAFSESDNNSNGTHQILPPISAPVREGVDALHHTGYDNQSISHESRSTIRHNAEVRRAMDASTAFSEKPNGGFVREENSTITNGFDYEAPDDFVPDESPGKHYFSLGVKNHNHHEEPLLMSHIPHVAQDNSTIRNNPAEIGNASGENSFDNYDDSNTGVEEDLIFDDIDQPKTSRYFGKNEYRRVTLDTMESERPESTSVNRPQSSITDFEDNTSFRTMNAFATTHEPQTSSSTYLQQDELYGETFEKVADQPRNGDTHDGDFCRNDRPESSTTYIEEDALVHSYHTENPSTFFPNDESQTYDALEQPSDRPSETPVNRPPTSSMYFEEEKKSCHKEIHEFPPEYQPQSSHAHGGEPSTSSSYFEEEKNSCRREIHEFAPGYQPQSSHTFDGDFGNDESHQRASGHTFEAPAPIQTPTNFVDLSSPSRNVSFRPHTENGDFQLEDNSWGNDEIIESPDNRTLGFRRRIPESETSSFSQRHTSRRPPSSRGSHGRGNKGSIQEAFRRQREFQERISPRPPSFRKSPRSSHIPKAGVPTKNSGSRTKPKTKTLTAYFEPMKLKTNQTDEDFLWNVGM